METVIPDKKEIEELYKKHTFALVNAFFTYTPFLKSVLLLKLFIRLFKTFAKITNKQMNDYIESLKLAQHKKEQFTLVRY